jgi:pimeloyl-ACP methyl ester carboxylesterase
MTKSTKTRPDEGPLVFLHGLGGSRADWQDVIELLPDGGRVVTIDLPGSAQGPKPETGYEPAGMARYVLEVLDGEKSGPVRLVGHSIGARVAGEVAALEGTRVQALVLVSPLGAVGYGVMDRLKWKAMSRRTVLQSVAESSIRGASGYGFVADSAGKKSFVERAVAARTGSTADAFAHAFERSVDGLLSAPPLVERLSGTRMPLMVVSGALDPLAPAKDSLAIKKVRPEATFVELPTMGHYPMIEDPRRFAALLQEFLGSR